MNTQKTKKQSKETFSNLEIKEKNPEQLKPIPIAETPFQSVQLPTGIKIVLGKWVISKRTFETHEEAAKFMNNLEWDLLVNIAGAYVDKAVEDAFSSFTQKQLPIIINNLKTNNNGNK